MSRRARIPAGAPLRDRRGSVSLELAAIFPFMAIMFFGCFETTQLVRVAMGLGVSSDAISDYIARASQPGGTDPTAEVTNACSGGQLMMAPFSGSFLGAAVVSVTYSVTSGAIAVDWSDTSCGTGTAAISDAVTLATALLTTPGDSVIIVQTTYNYAAPVHFVLQPSYTLTHMSYSRPRGSATGT
jgi:Flp pilus assembly protein TadG